MEKVVTKPLVTDATGKLIAEAIAQNLLGQQRISEINEAARLAIEAIETKTGEQLEKITEISELNAKYEELAEEVRKLNQNLLSGLQQYADMFSSISESESEDNLDNG